MTSVGILGCGMVGGIWLRDIPWGDVGGEPLVYDPAISELEYGKRVDRPTELAEAETILVFAPGSISQSAVHSIFPDGGKGPSEILDFSSNGPAGKEELSEWCELRNTSYVDITIMGIVSATGIRTPLVIAGQELSKNAKVLLDATGARLSALEGSKAGDAARLKLVRSMVMKGIEALVLESRQVAEDLGILDTYSNVFQDIENGSFTELLDGMVKTHPAHRERRGAEVREVLKMLNSLGRQSKLIEEVAKNYEDGPFRT